MPRPVRWIRVKEMKRKRTWVRLLASDIVRDHLAAGFETNL
jgi:hypothetical protein